MSRWRAVVGQWRGVGAVWFVQIGLAGGHFEMVRFAVGGGGGLRRCHGVYPPIIRRQSQNHWLNDCLLVQSVRSDQRERACPAITSISHAEGHWFDPSRDHKKRRGQQLFGGLATAGDCIYPPESAVGLTFRLIT
jgi:hypothetical protein